MGFGVMYRVVIKKPAGQRRYQVAPEILKRWTGGSPGLFCVNLMSCKKTTDFVEISGCISLEILV